MRRYGGLRVRLWWERAFWVIPTFGVLAGVLLASLTGRADVHVDALAEITPDSVRSILTAVGGGMVTFTGFVFSFVVLLLQFGSSQYSPRTVSYFLRARSTQDILAVFLCTATFSFLSLLTIHDGPRAKTPQLTVLVGVALLLASLLAFITLLHSVGARVRVDAVLARLGQAARVELGHRWRQREENSEGVEVGVPLDDDRPCTLVRHQGPTGQVVAVELRRLLRVARRGGGRIELLVRVGDAVSRGTPVMQVHGPVPTRGLESTVVVDVERSLRYDPLYALRLLVDVALRGLSPAVNDPTTAVRALDEIEDVLREAATLELGPRAVAAGSGVVVIRRPKWSDVVELALLEISIYGRGQPQVSRRLTAMLEDLEADVDEQRGQALRAVGARLDGLVRETVHPDLVDVALTADRQGLGGTRRETQG